MHKTQPQCYLRNTFRTHFIRYIYPYYRISNIYVSPVAPSIALHLDVLINFLLRWCLTQSHERSLQCSLLSPSFVLQGNAETFFMRKSFCGKILELVLIKFHTRNSSSLENPIFIFLDAIFVVLTNFPAVKELKVEKMLSHIFIGSVLPCWSIMIHELHHDMTKQKNNFMWPILKGM